MKIGYPYRSLDMSDWVYNHSKKEWISKGFRADKTIFGAHERAPHCEAFKPAWDHLKGLAVPVPYPPNHIEDTSKAYSKLNS